MYPPDGVRPTLIERTAHRAGLIWLGSVGQHHTRHATPRRSRKNSQYHPQPAIMFHTSLPESAVPTVPVAGVAPRGAATGGTATMGTSGTGQRSSEQGPAGAAGGPGSLPSAGNREGVLARRARDVGPRGDYRPGRTDSRTAVVFAAAGLPWAAAGLVGRVGRASGGVDGPGRRRRGALPNRSRGWAG